MCKVILLVIIIAKKWKYVKHKLVNWYIFFEFAEIYSMFTTLVRVVIIYVIILVLLRIMGKRQIGELQPFELVVTLIIADIATIPMSDSSIPLLNGIIPLVTLVLLQIFLSFLSRKSLFIRKLINGKPVIVMDSSGVVYDNLRALNMSLNDLTEMLRGCDVSQMDDVQYAFVETNGKASVILKSESAPLTPKITKQKTDKATFSIMLIMEGKINQENIKLAKVDENFLQKIVAKAKIKSTKEVLILSLDNAGKVYIQPKNGACQVLNVDFSGGDNW